MSDNQHYDPYEHEPLPEGVESAPPLTRTMAHIRWGLLIGLSLFALIMVLSAVGLAPWEARADDNIQYHCPMHPTYISSQPGECPICGMSLVPIDKAGKEIKDAEADGKTSMSPKDGQDAAKVDTMTGMEEMKSSDDSTAMATAKYVCPMHPEVTSDKPGECPKCGMDLVAVKAEPKAPPAKAKDSKAMESKAADKTLEAKVTYSCPMHPEVTSDKPGRCPKCNMFLQPVSDSSKTAPMDMPKKTKDVPKKTSEVHSDGMDGHAMSDMGKAPVPGLVPVTIEPQRLQLIGVRTALVERRDLGSATNIVGFVTPDETRLKNVNIRVNGWVTDLFVNETGQYVEAGKPLLSIYSQELYQAEQDFLVARDALQRNSTDAALTKMRQEIYSGAREKLHLLGISESQIDDIEKLVAPDPQLVIKSPTSGYVLEKNVLPGQYLSPNLNLFTIADLNRVWVLGDVYEQDISKVHVGQKATLRLAAFPGETFMGKIGYVYPTVSEKTRTLKVRFEFANSDLRLRPGMYAEISLAGRENETLTVPSDAIMDNGNIQYAFVVHPGGHFEPRQVATGRSSEDLVEIKSGLEAGETVAASANFLIDSESRLQAAVAGMTGSQDSPEQNEGQGAMPPGHVH